MMQKKDYEYANAFYQTHLGETGNELFRCEGLR